jgi:hypothetical protein
MILSLSAKDLESLFYGVLDQYFSQSLAVRHTPLEPLFTDFQEIIFLTVPKLCPKRISNFHLFR